MGEELGQMIGRLFSGQPNYEELAQQVMTAIDTARKDAAKQALLRAAEWCHERSLENYNRAEKMPEHRALFEGMEEAFETCEEELRRMASEIGE